MTPSAHQPNCTDIFESGLVTVDQALDTILSQIQPLAGVEKIPVEQANGRVLGEPVISSLDVPAHTNAAVDGFAITRADLPVARETKTLTIVGEALAGKPYPGPIVTGQTVRIMTGAMIPEGADTVVMQEQVELAGNDQIRIGDDHRAGDNIREAGEDLRRGETILLPGKALTPPDLGLIASLGRVDISVKRKIRVALISSGDEILPPGTPPCAGKIYDSNRFSLSGALDRLPIQIVDYGIVPDNPDRIRQVYTEAADRCDVVISSGGVSVGAADFVKKVLTGLGGIRFWKVAIKPGRPLAFGKIGPAAFFGLPGNPVAVMVTYYQFVRPALQRLAGIQPLPVTPTLRAQTLETLRKKPGRTEFQRGILEPDESHGWRVKATGKQGSGILRSMSLANCFIVLEHERGNVAAGESVTVIPFCCLM